MKPLCRHCCAKRVCRPRGLCWECYYTPGVRDLYPITSKYAPKAEPTEAELEATIAEQMRPENVPEWYWRDVQRRFQDRAADD